MVAAVDQMGWTGAKTFENAAMAARLQHKPHTKLQLQHQSVPAPTGAPFKLPLFSTVESRKIPQTSKRETENAILSYLNWAPILIMILHIGTWEESRSCRAAGRETRLPCSTLRHWCRLISVPDMSLARDLRWPNVLFTSCSKRGKGGERGDYVGPA